MKLAILATYFYLVAALDSYSQNDLIAAIRLSNVDISRVDQSNANSKDENNCGMTALMIACQNGDEDTVNALIRAGADVNAVNGKGNPR